MQSKSPLQVALVLLFFSINLLVLFILRENNGLLILYSFVFSSSLIMVFIYRRPMKVLFSKRVEPPVDSDITYYFHELLKHINQAFFIISKDERIVLQSEAVEKIFQSPVVALGDLRKYATLWGAVNQSIAIETGADFEWDEANQHFQTRIVPLRNKGIFLGLLVSIVDTTKQHNMDQIQTEFLADISHELKTPLAAIMGASEILNRETIKLPAKKRQEFLDIIENEANRMRRLMDELTHLSSLDNRLFSTLLKSKFVFSDMLQDVIRIHQTSLENSQLTVEVDQSCNVEIFMDRDKAIQIFSNLLSNAIRYTKKGGVRIRHSVVDRYSIITFSDTGAGIEPQNIPRIFDRFYRTDFARSRVSGGSGLGLAITRAIIEAHKGKIEVQSQLHQGTTFVISIPNIL
jgi:two-component system phosphate regulon sensor histidine kinase PhoR